MPTYTKIGDTQQGASAAQPDGSGSGQAVEGADAASHPVAGPKVIPHHLLPAAVTAASDGQAPGLKAEGIGQCTPDDPDGNGVAGFQKPNPKQAPADASALGQAAGRKEGDSWETRNADGTKVVYTIPTGNGDQSVDQVTYDKSGKAVSNSRVVSNGEGGFQQWSNDKGGTSSYRSQDKPGADVTTMAWRPGVDASSSPPYSVTTSSWDGTRSSTEAVDEKGVWSRVDKVKTETGGWETQTTAEDGSVRLARVDPDGKLHLIGETDAKGTGWVDDGNGGAAKVHRDEHGNQVTVSTNKETGSQTTTYVDPKSGLQRSRVTDKSGKQIGTVDYDKDGKPVSGVVVDGGVRTSWVNGIATITHDGKNEKNKDWKKQVVAADGSVEQFKSDGSKDKFDAAGAHIDHTDAPDNRPAWKKALTGTGNFFKGVGKGAWGTVKGLGSLVGIGGKGGPGVGEAWVGFGKGLGNILWTYNPQVVATKTAYDVVRTLTSKDYVAENPVDRVSGMTNAWLGVDPRNFGKDGIDSNQLAGEAVFGAAMFFVPVKGTAALKAGAKAASKASPAVAKAAARVASGAEKAAANTRFALNRYALNKVAKHADDLTKARPSAVPGVNHPRFDAAPF
ncbi:hypothetical protein [Gordonia crocea]|nr:hypothetical protein [Gordonia crocea]